MKTILTLSLALLAAAAFAGPGPGDYPSRIGTRAAAEKLPATAKTALACTMCKTVQPARDRASFLALFDAKAQHDCGGCKGKVTYKEHAGGKGAHSEFTYECTMCGAKSAYTCAGHVKG